MKSLISKFTFLGLVIPIVILAIWGLFGGIVDNELTFKIFGFFWPAFFGLLGMTHIDKVWGQILAYAFLIGINLIYYAFLGWLFELGKTENKLVLVAPLLTMLIIWITVYVYNYVFLFFLLIVVFSLGTIVRITKK